MTATPRPGFHLVRHAAGVVVCVALVGGAMTGCTADARDAAGPSPSLSPTPSAGAFPATGGTADDAAPDGAVIVTVPGLVGTDSAGPAPSSGPLVSRPVAVGTPAGPIRPATVVSAPAASGSGGLAVTPSPAAVAAASSPAPPTPPAAIGPVSAASSESAAPVSTAPVSTAAVSTVAVSVAGCPACRVLATLAAVRAGFSAALIAPGQRRAALISLRADGSVGGVINVPYGASFPSPTGAALPCDQAGRCLVTALRSDGHAVVSAWQLGMGGSWADVSIPGGFVSFTGRAGPVDLDGGLGVGVQVASGGGATWLVYSWSGQGYAVLGCTAGGAQPDLSGLSPDNCPS